MVLKEFLDLLLPRADAANTAGQMPAYEAEKKEEWLAALLAEIPKERQTEPLRRKVAAKAVHGFLLEVLGEPDEDWGEAAKLADIYECRVCANAVAQVCVKGIMEPVSKAEFGGNLPLSETEAERVTDRVCGRIRG
ncbi:MAG: hypothetical protein IKS07_00530 [Lachnospiraceae bacterium]|nr:hypothetical protein [Lachnospiraceae bacterium]